MVDESIDSHILSLAYKVAIEKKRKIKLIYFEGKIFRIKVKLSKILNRAPSFMEYANVKIKRVGIDEFNFYESIFLGLDE